MIRNYYLVFKRGIIRSPFIFLVKVFGLIIGTTTFMLALIYILSEKSYDQFHENVDNIYRLNVEYGKDGNVEYTSAMSYPAAGPTFVREIPQVESSCRLRTVWGVLRSDVEDGMSNDYMVDNIVYADDEFFDIFSFDIIKGNSKNPLEEPHTAVISRDIATKLFGQSNPIGKVIKLKYLNEFEPYRVTAVMEDMPSNSHINYDVILSYKSFVNYVGSNAENSWTWFGFYTYIKVKKNTNIGELKHTINEILDTHLQDGASTKLLLQPLKNIHLKSDLIDEAQINGSERQIWYLILIAAFVLVVGWVNFINLVSGGLIMRAKEIGVRKLLGARSGNVLEQYLFENIFYSVISFIVSLVLVYFALDSAQTFLGFQVAFTLRESIIFWAIVLLTMVLGSIIVTVFLTAVLKLISYMNTNSYAIGHKSLIIRKGLLIVQFGVAIFFVTFTAVIYSQLDYLKTKDKGFNDKNVLVLRSPTVNTVNSNYISERETFKNVIKSLNGVVQFTASDNIPGQQNENMNGGIRRVEANPDSGTPYRIVKVDEDFFDTYEMGFVSGRSFQKDMASDNQKVVINQAAVKRLGFPSEKEAIKGQIVYYNGQNMEVLGVVNDYNQLSFKNAIEPLIFELNQVNNMFDDKFYSIRYDTSKVSELTKLIQREWESFFPDNPFISFSLTEFYQRQYAKERQFARTFFLLSFITIISSLLGVIGLLLFINRASMKEICIRKVFGGSLFDLIKLSTKALMIYILAGVTVGLILSYSMASDWLENYYERIHLNWQYFLLPALIPITITLVSIFIQVTRIQNLSASQVLRDN